MKIDNFDRIKSLMLFREEENLFMHLQILRRGKDHPNLPAANKLIKSWLVMSPEHLDSLKDEVVFLCEHYKARAYISCVPKSIEKLNQLIMRKLSDNQYTGNIVNPWHVFNSACGELPGFLKRWVIDVDTKDGDAIERIMQEIDRIWLNTHPEDKAESGRSQVLRSERITRSGHSYIYFFDRVSGPVSVVHNPDCPCRKKVDENE